MACPKSEKHPKRNPWGVPFWHFFFMEVFFSGGKPMGKLLELELWELIVQYEAACSPNHVSRQVMPDASMLCSFWTASLRPGHGWGIGRTGGHSKSHRRSVKMKHDGDIRQYLTCYWCVYFGHFFDNTSVGMNLKLVSGTFWPSKSTHCAGLQVPKLLYIAIIVMILS